jgi:hypothetical protein
MPTRRVPTWCCSISIFRRDGREVLAEIKADSTLQHIRSSS